MKKFSVVLSLLLLCILLCFAACKNLAGTDAGEETSSLYRGNDSAVFTRDRLA